MVLAFSAARGKASAFHLTRAPLLLGLALLAATVTGAVQPAITEGWSDHKLQAAFHDVLLHGDLSDIEFTARALGMSLEIADPGKPTISTGESAEMQVIATRVPPYMRSYGLFYVLKKDNKTDTTRIDFSFQMNSCPDLVPWGKIGAKRSNRPTGTRLTTGRNLTTSRFHGGEPLKE
jgi:hypothetical protein